MDHLLLAPEETATHQILRHHKEITALLESLLRVVAVAVAQMLLAQPEPQT
jgi:hypothetical protein